MPTFKKKQGSILVMSTLILSILAGLSISTMQNVVTEFQLTNQNQDKTLALQSAQFALSEAKRLLLTNWSQGASTCTAISSCTASNGIAVWSYNAFIDTTDLSKQPSSFFTTNAQAANAPNSKVAAPPRFFVIDLGCDPYSKSNIYRIAALGFGTSLTSVAYAESQLTIPLTGQNNYSGAITQAVPALLNGTQVSSYNLAPSTNSKTLFFSNGAPSNCPQGTGTGATCEMNCMNEVRVKGYSYFNTNSTSCPWIYGDWVSGSGAVSQITLSSNSSGQTATVACRAPGTIYCSDAINLQYACCSANASYYSCAPVPTTCTLQSVTCPACNATTNESTACCIANYGSPSSCTSTTCAFSGATCPDCASSACSDCYFDFLENGINSTCTTPSTCTCRNWTAPPLFGPGMGGLGGWGGFGS
ncbi:MAG: hypothetical protein KBD23_02975 [Gammaproteobacteria bacterium]|nr:hypothetical protein [Gammaproteobacteria bacterium]MBP9729088.1 hypothetical protein [Gammaproteobacteria bacterium]